MTEHANSRLDSAYESFVIGEYTWYPKRIPYEFLRAVGAAVKRLKSNEHNFYSGAKICATGAYGDSGLRKWRLEMIGNRTSKAEELASDD